MKKIYAVIFLSVFCNITVNAKEFEYDKKIALEFSQLIFRDFAKSKEKSGYSVDMKKKYDLSNPIIGSFIDHADRRFVYIMYPDVTGKKSVFHVIAEICSGYGSAIHEYHLSDQGISLGQADEQIKNLLSMESDKTADLPHACPCKDESE